MKVRGAVSVMIKMLLWLCFMACLAFIIVLFQGVNPYSLKSIAIIYFVTSSVSFIFALIYFICKQDK